MPAARAANPPPPRNPEAYDEWLKGTLAWQQVGGGGATIQEIDRVEAMFTRAIALDDTYGAAYADRGRVRIARVASHADGSEATRAGAHADIALAEKYAGGTPHVLVRAAQLAFLVDHDLRRALGLIEAAEQVGPLNADLLLTKGNFLSSAGRLEESLAVESQAARLDPGNAGIYRLLAGDAAGAAKEGAILARFVEALPKVGWNDWWRQLLGAESALMLGQRQRAIDQARAATRVIGDTPTFPPLLHVRLMATRILTWAGEADEALALLETLSRGYPGAGPATLVRDPFFTTRLGSNPRWRALSQALDAEIATNQRLLRPGS